MFINNFDPVAFNSFIRNKMVFIILYYWNFAWIRLSKRFFINDLQVKVNLMITIPNISCDNWWKLGYVLFYNLNYYLNNITDIFKIWQVACHFMGIDWYNYCKYLVCKKKYQNAFVYLDIVSEVSPIGIFLEM